MQFLMSCKLHIAARNLQLRSQLSDHKAPPTGAIGHTCLSEALVLLGMYYLYVFLYTECTGPAVCDIFFFQAGFIFLFFAFLLA